MTVIHFDVTNDAPAIETVPNSSEDLQFIITTLAIEGEEDEVLFTPPGSAPSAAIEEVPFLTSVKTTSNTARYYTHERDLPGYGLYAVICWTRRGQKRQYTFSLAPIEGDDQHCRMTLIPVGSAATWVTDDEVYPVKDKTVAIDLPIAS